MKQVSGKELAKIIATRGCRCAWGEYGIILTSTDGTRFHTQPGDAEEQILLNIVKAAYAHMRDPTLDEQDKAWFKQHAVERFIRGLEWRCVNKRKQAYGDK